jgi:hypothetical protein
MHNGLNLVGVAASSNTKFINRLMEILFSEQERRLGLIIDGQSVSQRQKLDGDRVKKLKSKCFLLNIYS